MSLNLIIIFFIDSLDVEDWNQELIDNEEVVNLIEGLIQKYLHVSKNLNLQLIKYLRDLYVLSIFRTLILNRLNMIPSLSRNPAKFQRN